MRFFIASIIMIAFLYALSGCTAPGRATRILEDDGFTDVEITGYNFFACSNDDWYHTGFRAKRGERTVYGTVCSGLIFRNSTIRFE